MPLVITVCFKDKSQFLMALSKPLMTQSFYYYGAGGLLLRALVQSALNFSFNKF